LLKWYIPINGGLELGLRFISQSYPSRWGGKQLRDSVTKTLIYCIISGGKFSIDISSKLKDLGISILLGDPPTKI
jgi:hypothetical protein